MRFVCIDFDSPKYEATLRLRDEVLRKPLGMVLADEDLTAEAGQWHFGLEDDETQGDGEIIACVVVRPINEHEAQLRQMAVASAWQRRGVGRRLIDEVERFLNERGVQQLMLHARQVAISFYERLGYRCEGATYIEVGIPHRTMHKSIAAQG